MFLKPGHLSNFPRMCSLPHLPHQQLPTLLTTELHHHLLSLFHHLVARQGTLQDTVRVNMLAIARDMFTLTKLGVNPDRLNKAKEIIGMLVNNIQSEEMQQVSGNPVNS